MFRDGAIEFVNADEIARGLSPFNPAGQRMKAGKLVISRIRELIVEKKKFAIETTLSGRTLPALIRKAKENGFVVRMFYVHTTDVELNIKRIETRVIQGGHDVPSDDVRRRYGRSLHNLFHVYFDLCDIISVYDNSADTEKLIAVKGMNDTPGEEDSVMVFREHSGLWRIMKKQAGLEDEDERV